MSDTPLLRIGDFSRASSLSVKTLRADHEAGPLEELGVKLDERVPPAWVQGVLARNSTMVRHSFLGLHIAEPARTAPPPPSHLGGRVVVTMTSLGT